MQMTETLPEMLTPQEVADIFRVNLRTIYRKVKNNQIPYCKLGTGMIRFPKKEILDLINSQRNPSN
jgi:excisionase family DNA binding protein